MSYNIKIVRGSESRVYPCTSYIVKVNAPDSPVVRMGLEEAGVAIRLDPTRQEFSLPKDGDAIFITNDRGKTIDTHRWPMGQPKE